MAPARRARSPDDAQLYADDTDSDQGQETPRPQKNGLKKRLSEAYNPENDASFTSDSGRPPLRSVNINDDAAEKRRRRKSTKIAVIENAVAGPSSEGNGDPDGPETSRTAKQKQQLRSVAAPPVINVSKDVMSSNFEEWMKMATDNKINAANSWNFALIDYFHDMSLLRNNDDNSINFQRASCTLDGCVKIWTSRVDSVGTETGKLLSNLTSEATEGGEGEEGDGDGKPKKSRGPAATLAKDISQLQSKKPDLEFSVDPLFRKTCADFDEGGAQGLLMNHLSLGVGSDGGMRVVFDASDSMGKVEEEEAVEEPEDEIDLSYLRKEFLPDVAALEDKAISHSLAGFAFSKDALSFDDTTFFQDSTRRDLDDDEDDNDAGVDGGDGMDIDGGGPPVEDFFVGPDAVQEDYGGDMMGGDDYGGDNNSNGSVGPQGSGDGQTGPFVPFDPRRAPNERDLVMAMTDADGEEGMMDYFDQNFLKNWAGPEHWKLRRVIRRPDADANAANKPKARKEKKEAFKIDFLTPVDPDKDLKEIQKELFAPVTKGAGINLPGTGAAAKKSRKKTKDKEKRDDHRLPDDMHFSSKQLVTLFLKPKFYLKMRGKRVKMNPNDDGEVDENFWAQAAADQAAGRGGDQDGDETMNDGAIPFNTQFFHDDYDDGPGFDDVDPYDGDGGAPGVDAGEQDLLASTEGQTKRVRPEFVNYAKRAKRVDVRKLKDNIWRGLDIVVPPPKKADGDESMDVDESLPPPTEPNEPRVFSQVISGLQKSYPKDKMEEISTSFCFICLLHLANEQGLKLESRPDGIQAEKEVGKDEDKKIGNIWDLKIYLDPNATQSA
ncbi:putative regulatory subunit of the condensin complex, a complex required for conversion of interphase chromatin into mitotic-like condense chromosomes [Lyophyllum shimeji]|uniref:Condensin complex subunit 2 n=1 Tax=Lyophyllum shimeji TaxID=47721 RepID=A0A9P3PUC8_LYOSH|nr:putative regulatory subunit of the condensin complex, a complex required for conversion of interphase chromatin into mitotic-like condense chromosomes [Lyophyllum shimeji]